MGWAEQSPPGPALLSVPWQDGVWPSPGLMAPCHPSCFVSSFSPNHHSVHPHQEKFCRTCFCTMEPPFGGAQCPHSRGLTPQSSKVAWVNGSPSLAPTSSRCCISSIPSTCCTEFLRKLRDVFYEELFQGLKPVQNMMFVTGQFRCNLKSIYFWPTCSSSAYRETK